MNNSVIHPLFIDKFRACHELLGLQGPAQSLGRASTPNEGTVRTAQDSSAR